MTMKTVLRILSGAAMIAPLMAALGTMLPAHAATQPNIVFIMADDLGYGALGSYGQTKIKTPHLDRMAQEGMRFTQSYAGAALCAASRSILMTGYHGGHTSVRGNSGGIPLRDEDVTVAEVLKKAGYRTGLFGKWGLGDAETTGVPNKQGFDEFFGYLHQKHAHFYYTDYLWHNEERYPFPENRNGARETYVHDVTMEKAIEFIQADHDAPFFCYISVTIPHHEWVAPEASVKPYLGQFSEERPTETWRQGYNTPDAPKANMAGMISHMDQGVGMVLDALEESGLAENTLVIFTSDNGADRYPIACADFFDANGGLRGYKYDQYEGGIRVPTIAHWPGTVKKGAVNDLPFHFADYMATFADLAGASDQVPGDVDGISIVAAFTGARDAALKNDRFLYWEDLGGQRAGRLGRWKAVQRSPESPLELYDLDTDMAETTNVAVQHPDVVAKLYALLDANHSEARPQIEPHAPKGRYYR
ncbi:MAG: sulfatase-like hydrolase/transferase [Candidatus Hydrogenedentes bacterium]|nr:sulfatase-like hydrolase/transferase [Candidatus Hydrogenedentota bacterium]